MGRGSGCLYGLLLVFGGVIAIVMVLLLFRVISF